MLAWIEQQLIIRSPVRTGRYQRSHRVFVDGIETAIADIAAGVEQVVFAPLVPMLRRSSRTMDGLVSHGRRRTASTRRWPRWPGSATGRWPTSASPS
jgi:hypothetical protein